MSERRTAADGLILLVPEKSDPERDAVADEWARAGGEVLRLGRFWDPPELPAEKVRVHGGGAFCMVLAEKLALSLISPPDDLLAYLDEKWLGRAVQIHPLHRALQDRRPVFVKPVVPKQFQAAVYSSRAELESQTEGLDPETSVFVSEIVEIRAEVRSFLLDGRATTAAVYEGSADVQDAVRFAECFATECTLPRTLVLDLGLLANGKWVLIEANATWGAGLNGCSAEGVVPCLAQASGPILRESES